MRHSANQTIIVFKVQSRMIVASLARAHRHVASDAVTTRRGGPPASDGPGPATPAACRTDGVHSTATSMQRVLSATPAPVSQSRQNPAGARDSEPANLYGSSTPATVVLYGSSTPLRCCCCQTNFYRRRVQPSPGRDSGKIVVAGSPSHGAAAP